MKKCPKCGTQVNDDIKKCPDCKADLSAGLIEIDFLAQDEEQDIPAVKTDYVASTPASSIGNYIILGITGILSLLVIVLGFMYLPGLMTQLLSGDQNDNTNNPVSINNTGTVVNDQSVLSQFSGDVLAVGDEFNQLITGNIITQLSTGDMASGAILADKIVELDEMLTNKNNQYNQIKQVMSEYDQLIATQSDDMKSRYNESKQILMYYYDNKKEIDEELIENMQKILKFLQNNQDKINFLGTEPEFGSAGLNKAYEVLKGKIEGSMNKSIQIQGEYEEVKNEFKDALQGQRFGAGQKN